MRNKSLCLTLFMLSLFECSVIMYDSDKLKPDSYRSVINRSKYYISQTQSTSTMYTFVKTVIQICNQPCCLLRPQCFMLCYLYELLGLFNLMTLCIYIYICNLIHVNRIRFSNAFRKPKYCYPINILFSNYNIFFCQFQPTLFLCIYLIHGAIVYHSFTTIPMLTYKYREPNYINNMLTKLDIYIYMLCVFYMLLYCALIAINIDCHVILKINVVDSVHTCNYNCSRNNINQVTVISKFKYVVNFVRSSLQCCIPRLFLSTFVDKLRNNYTYLCIIDFNRVLLCKSLYFLDLTLHCMCLDCRLMFTYHALYHMIYVGTNVSHVYMLFINIYNNG